MSKVSKKDRKAANKARKIIAEKSASPAAPTAIQPAGTVARVLPKPKKAEITPEETAPEIGIGYIAEIRKDADKVLFWKVVTINPATGEYVTAIAPKPKEHANVGAKLSMTLAPYYSKWSAVNVTVVEPESSLTPFLEQIADIKNEVEESDNGTSLFPSQIVSKLLMTPHKSSTLPQALGYKQILGRVAGGVKIQFA